MHTVYIFIPDRIYYSPAGPAGARLTTADQLGGHVRFHTHATTGDQQCTIYITRCMDTKEQHQRIDTSSEAPVDAELCVGSVDVLPNAQADGIVRRPSQPVDVQFTTQQQPTATSDKRPRQRLQLRLEALRVPGLTAATRVKLITYSRRVPPVFAAALQMPTQLAADARAVRQRTVTSGGGAGALLQAGCRRTVAALECIGSVCPVLRHTAVFQHVLSRCTLMARPSV